MVAISLSFLLSTVHASACHSHFIFIDSHLSLSFCFPNGIFRPVSRKINQKTKKTHTQRKMNKERRVLFVREFICRLWFEPPVPMCVCAICVRAAETKIHVSIICLFTCGELFLYIGGFLSEQCSVSRHAVPSCLALAYSKKYQHFGWYIWIRYNRYFLHGLVLFFLALKCIHVCVHLMWDKWRASEVINVTQSNWNNWIECVSLLFWGFFVWLFSSLCFRQLLRFAIHTQSVCVKCVVREMDSNVPNKNIEEEKRDTHTPQ